jgi:hypothetical protein
VRFDPSGQSFRGVIYKLAGILEGTALYLQGSPLKFPAGRTPPQVPAKKDRHFFIRIQ